MDKDGFWIWCIDSVTVQPDLAVLQQPVNKESGGLNGVVCTTADVFGFEPTAWPWPADGNQNALCRKTSIKKRKTSMTISRTDGITNYIIHMTRPVSPMCQRVPARLPERLKLNPKKYAGKSVPLPTHSNRRVTGTADVNQNHDDG